MPMPKYLDEFERINANDIDAQMNFRESNRGFQDALKAGGKYAKEVDSRINQRLQQLVSTPLDVFEQQLFAPKPGSVDSILSDLHKGSLELIPGQQRFVNGLKDSILYSTPMIEEKHLEVPYSMVKDINEKKARRQQNDFIFRNTSMTQEEQPLKVPNINIEKKRTISKLENYINNQRAIYNANLMKYLDETQPLISSRDFTDREALEDSIRKNPMGIEGEAYLLNGGYFDSSGNTAMPSTARKYFDDDSISFKDRKLKEEAAKKADLAKKDDARKKYYQTQHDIRKAKFDAPYEDFNNRVNKAISNQDIYELQSLRKSLDEIEASKGEGRFNSLNLDSGRTAELKQNLDDYIKMAEDDAGFRTSQMRRLSGPLKQKLGLEIDAHNIAEVEADPRTYGGERVLSVHEAERFLGNPEMSGAFGSAKRITQVRNRYGAEANDATIRYNKRVQDVFEEARKMRAPGDSTPLNEYIRNNPKLYRKIVEANNQEFAAMRLLGNDLVGTLEDYGGVENHKLINFSDKQKAIMYRAISGLGEAQDEVTDEATTFLLKNIDEKVTADDGTESTRKANYRYGSHKITRRGVDKNGDWNKNIESDVGFWREEIGDDGKVIAGSRKKIESTDFENALVDAKKIPADAEGAVKTVTTTDYVPHSGSDGSRPVVGRAEFLEKEQIGRLARAYDKSDVAARIAGTGPAQDSGVFKQIAEAASKHPGYAAAIAVGTFALANKALDRRREYD